jgi:hypothetical protein
MSHVHVRCPTRDPVLYAVLHATSIYVPIPPPDRKRVTRHGAHAPTSRRDEMRGALRAISGLRYTARRHAHRRIVQALDYRTDRCTL